MKRYPFNLKHERLEILNSIFVNEKIDPKGVYHMQRQVPLMNIDDALTVASYDLAQVEYLFSPGTIVFCSLKNDSLLSITMRLHNDTILKYVLSANDFFKPRLRLNFSVSGRVFEYDDRHQYLETTQEMKESSFLDERYPFTEMFNRIQSCLEVGHE